MAQQIIFGYCKSNEFLQEKFSRVLRLNHAFIKHNLYHKNGISLTEYVKGVEQLHASSCRSKYKIFLTTCCINKIFIYVLIAVKLV